MPARNIYHKHISQYHKHVTFCVAGVIVLTAVVNPFRLYKLDRVEKFVMSYGGLRGAVAFALVLLINPEHVRLQPMFVTTTIAVIYFTVFIQVSTSLMDFIRKGCFACINLNVVYRV